VETGPVFFGHPFSIMIAKSISQSFQISFRISVLAVTAVLLVGCSARGRSRPLNSIREPVFHTVEYTTVGLGFGRVLILGSNGLDSIPDIIYANRFLAWDVPVSRWAEYNLLPVHWNFLLTGEQYADSVRLLTHKLHASAYGGINGFSYSQRDDWTFPADIGMQAKILLSDEHYLVSQGGMDFFHFLAPEENRLHLKFGYGWQVTESNAIELDYHVSYFNLSDDSYFRDIFYYLGGDTQTELNLHHHFHLKGRHVMGPEIGWGARNLDLGRDDYYKAGLNYRYVFP
jgi:hypothetical protein